jgi:hypothetical protein
MNLCMVSIQSEKQREGREREREREEKQLQVKSYRTTIHMSPIEERMSRRIK